MRYLLRIRNLAQLVCVNEPGKNVLLKAGSDQNEVFLIERGTIIVGLDGLIAGIGRDDDEDFNSQYIGAEFTNDIDGTGKCVIPGLVDSHTHPVWSGDRVHEFAMKLAGATYMDIHKIGGGINFTVRHVRESTEAELETLLMERLNRMLLHGTTLAEAKTGYGLDLETELKMLRVLNSAMTKHPIELSPTFLGAHSVPSGSTPEQATVDIVENQIPSLKLMIESGQVKCDNIDVFCEKGVFDVEQTRRILQEGKNAGLAINFHGEELSCLHSVEMASEIGTTAISHLEEISEEGIDAMAKNSVIAVLLPTTAHILHLQPPPARKMIQRGVPVALGTDFNPNAHCLSMPFIMNLACVQMRLTLNEALVGATINSAASIKRSHTHGSLDIGKVGDMILINAPRWEHIAYQMVDPPIHAVIKKGHLVVSK
eukprot:c27982_g1_i1.p1 GENE.c27982_g1_i1~~c27982_g1_i1.p1  ORF type:complete len:427 (-),score=216.85 c27982_g1_i1:314-1594(-)